MASLDRLDASGLRGRWNLSLAFGIRRVFRIYPLSVLCVLLIPIFRIPPSPSEVYSWIGTWHFCSNLALAQSLTYSPNILDVLWSLPLEVEMYCLLPLIYFVIRSGRYRSLLVWVLAVVAGLTIPGLVGRLSVFLYAPCFAAGVLAFDLSRTVRPGFPSWLWPCAIGLAMCLFGPLDNISLPDKMPRAWILSLGLGLFLPFCIELRAPSVARACHYIAKYSYGIYLSHSIVFWVVLYKMDAFPWPIRLVTLIAASVTVPVAMYHLVEAPLIRVGGRLASSVRSG